MRRHSPRTLAPAILVVRRSLRTAWLLALGLAGASPLLAQAPDRPAALERVRWLTGCWLGQAGTSTVEEHWLPLRAGTLVGASRASRGERTTDVELAIVRLRADTLVFEAHPVGQGPAHFPAVAQSDSSVTFANPAHDFPQRIRYWRVGSDSLRARVEGPGPDGRTRGLDFRYLRVACGPAAP